MAIAFVRRFARRYGKKGLRLSRRTLSVLRSHDWPGNVRELKNVIHRAVVCCEGRTITPDCLPERLGGTPAAESELRFAPGTPLEEVEERVVLSTLDAVANNRQKASELLGISRRALYNKLKQYGIC